MGFQFRTPGFAPVPKAEWKWTSPNSSYRDFSSLKDRFVYNLLFMYKEVVEAKLFHLVHPLRIKGGSLGKVTFKTLGITCGDTHDPCRITPFHENATAAGGFPIESACFRAKYIRLRHDGRDFY